MKFLKMFGVVLLLLVVVFLFLFSLMLVIDNLPVIAATISAILILAVFITSLIIGAEYFL